MSVRRAPFVAIAVALAGCWSLTNVGDLTSGASGGRTDANGSGGDGGALPLGDAGGDAGDAGAGCARFPGAFFCDDFERADALGDTFWTRHSPPASGSIDLVTYDFASPTHAAKIGLSGGGGCEFIQLSKTVPGAVTRVTLHAAVRIDRDALGPLSFMIPKGDGSSYPIILDARGNGDLAVMVQHVTGSNVTDFPEGAAAFAAPPFGAWTDAELTVETSPARVARARVGATVATTDLPAEIPMADVAAAVGIYCSAKTRAVLIDDVAITVDR